MSHNIWGCASNTCFYLARHTKSSTLGNVAVFFAVKGLRKELKEASQ